MEVKHHISIDLTPKIAAFRCLTIMQRIAFPGLKDRSFGSAVCQSASKVGYRNLLRRVVSATALTGMPVKRAVFRPVGHTKG